MLPEFACRTLATAARTLRTHCLPWPHVAALLVLGKAHVYPLDIFGEYERPGAESDGQQLRLQLAHALGQGRHDGVEDCAIAIVIVESSRDAVRIPLQRHVVFT